jgi:hypothetical protein
MKEGRATLMTDPVLRPHALTAADQERLVSLNGVGYPSSDIAALTGWDEVLGGVVPGVSVDVVREQAGLSAAVVAAPGDRRTAPVTRMRSWSDLLVEDDDMPSNSAGGVGERVVMDVVDHVAVGHDGNASTKGCSS